MVLEKYPNLFSKYAKVAVGPARLEILDLILGEIERYQNLTKNEVTAIERYNDVLSKAKAGDLDPLKQYYYNWPVDYVEKKIKSIKTELPKKIRTLEQEIRISKIKQFHGRIHIEYTGGDEYIRGIISAIELISGTLCDLCGKPGKPYGKQWVYISCDEHINRDMHIKWHEEDNE
jgi:hypothetical protein